MMGRWAIACGLALAAAPVAVIACGSFGSSDEPTGSDGGVSEGAPSSESASRSDAPSSLRPVPCDDAGPCRDGKFCCHVNEDPFPAHCAAAGECTASNEIKVYCESTASCPAGNVCCVSIADTYNVRLASCAPACAAGELRLCDPGAMGECGTAAGCKDIRVANKDMRVGPPFDKLTACAALGD